MIRQALEKDVEKIGKLMYQIHKVHSDGRPDLFVVGDRKLSDDKLKNLIEDYEMRPVFVYTDDNDEVLGYIMCQYEETGGGNALVARKVLYIDDFCVDESARGQQIGTKLYNFVTEVAKNNGCQSITLHVWNFNEGAKKFYEKIGFKPLKTLMERKLESE